jgi:hypothetical protein
MTYAPNDDALPDEDERATALALSWYFDYSLPDGSASPDPGGFMARLLDAIAHADDASLVRFRVSWPLLTDWYEFAQHEAATFLAWRDARL